MPPAKTTSKKSPDQTGDGECPTKTRLLDTTEKLIAKNGVRAVSIRDIARAARVNLAAINYHFGSKDRLLRAIVERRTSELSSRRVKALDALEQAGGGVTAEALMKAFIGPCVACDAKSKQHHEMIARMMHRFFMEDEDMVSSVAIAQFEPFRTRFVALLKRAVPSVPGAEMLWRAMLAMGVLHHHPLLASIHERVMGRRPAPEVEMRRLLAFCAAGLRAPASDAKRGAAQKGAPLEK
ncbi:MAG: TetR/AcrR family transcriptional regulator [Opitutaceae bacterium]|jgi:AcrR family transcriptional regulator|nr:TetR/AcrR family transcriptional regulator [Opitutaceae bacterium]